MKVTFAIPLIAFCFALLPRQTEAASINGLIGKLNSGNDDNVVYGALQELAQLESEAAPAVSAIKDLLDDEEKSKNIRLEAMVTLGAIGPSASAAVSSLITQLSSEDVSYRSNAASALGGIGPNASAAVATLVTCLEDDAISVRRKSAKALGSIRHTSNNCVAALEAAMNSTSDAAFKANCKAAIRQIQDAQEQE